MHKLHKAAADATDQHLVRHWELWEQSESKYKWTKVVYDFSFSLSLPVHLTIDVVVA